MKLISQCLYQHRTDIAVTDKILANVLDYLCNAIYIRGQRLLVIVKIVSRCRRYLASVDSCTGGIIADKPNTVSTKHLQMAEGQPMRLQNHK